METKLIILGLFAVGYLVGLYCAVRGAYEIKNGKLKGGKHEMHYKSNI